MENLKEEFLKLSEEEKMDFIQEIIPEMCQIFKKNPQKMIQEFMPAFKEMLASGELDMVQMMAMMMQQDDDDGDCCSGSSGCC